ncbi:MAG: hypothetical protein V1794_04530 [Candidatus Glassbacteria bacterium]
MKTSKLDRSLRLILAALSVVLVRTGVTRACEDMSVRDAAFGYVRDVHLLTVMARPGDSQAERIYAGLESWADSLRGELNLEVGFVNADDPAVRWEDYGVPSAPPSLPVVVLTGRPSASTGRSNFVVDHWEPGPAEDDLKLVESSPARERIRELVGRKLAVVVYVPGNDGGSPIGREAVEAVAGRWSERESLGVEVLEVDRGDEAERLLLSFMGVGRDGPDWAGVVFGRGKLMPPLQGEEITEAALEGQLQILLGDCSCLQNPRALGVDLPLAWEAALDSAVVAFRGPAGSTVNSAGLLKMLGPALWVIGGLVLLVGTATVAILRKGNGAS